MSDTLLPYYERELDAIKRLAAEWYHAHGHASNGWTDEQAAAFAAQCDALGFVDARVQQHAGGRSKALSVTARAM